MFDSYESHLYSVPTMHNGLTVHVVRSNQLTLSMVRLSTLLWRAIPDVLMGGQPMHIVLEMGNCWMHIGTCSTPKPNMRIADIYIGENTKHLNVPVGLVVQWSWEYVLKGIVRKNVQEQETVVRFLKACLDRTMSMGVFAQEFREMFCKSIHDKKIQL